MKKKEKRKWNRTLLGCGLISLMGLANLLLSSIAFGQLFFEMAPIGAIIWLPLNVAIILFGIFFASMQAQYP